MIQRREAQLPAGASGASAQSPPTAPLRAGGLRAIRRAGKRPARFRKNRFFVHRALRVYTKGSFRKFRYPSARDEVIYFRRLSSPL